MTKTLVLGATGLVGSALWDSRREDADFLWPTRSEIDLTRGLSEQDLPVGVGRIIYLAQGRNYRDFPGGAEETFTVNAVAPVRLLAHYVPRGLSQFVYASSGNVSLSQGAASVSDVPQRDFYTATKLAAEETLNAWGDLLTMSIVRIYTVYGQGAAPRSLVQRLRSALRAQEPILLNGDAGDLFQPTAARDVAGALLQVIDMGWAGVANFAGPEKLTIQQMATRLATLEGLAPVFSSSGLPSADYSLQGRRIEDALPLARARTVFPGV